MEKPKVFMTGITGYIGGDALDAIYRAHPDWDYTALVRNSEKGALVAKQYPSIKLVYGTLDDAALLEEQAMKNNIILNFADADHVAGARALAAGCAAHDKGDPAYFIHTSGTGILLYPDVDRKTFGESSNIVYDDVDDVDKLVSLPDHAFHRNVDKIVLDVGTREGSKQVVKTAIVCPPTIYGPGRGPGNQRSIQMPDLAKCSLKRGKVFQVGAGKTYWTNVHVRDLSNAYLLLVEAAASGGGKASWGGHGYYFTENGEHVWGDVSRELATKAQQLGFLPSSDVESLDPDTVHQMRPFGHCLWGANSRGRASRMRRELGWQPTGESLSSTMDQLLKSENESQ